MTYDRYFPEQPWFSARTKGLKKSIAERKKSIDASEFFEAALVRHYPWEQTYTVSEYLTLLQTYTDHTIVEPTRKRKLFDDIRKTIEDFGGRIQIPYLAVLYLSKKKLNLERLAKCVIPPA